MSVDQITVDKFVVMPLLLGLLMPSYLADKVTVGSMSVGEIAVDKML
jgi:hypothetical protein